MTHPDDGAIQSYLHGEMASARRSGLEQHTRACAECAERLAAARAEDVWVLDRLRGLDVEVAAAGGSAVARAAMARPAGAGGVRRAAVLLAGVLLGGASLAWALSAGRTLLAGRLAPRAATGVAAAGTPATTDDPAGERRGPTAPAGLAVVPSSPFVIRFEAPQDSGELRITLVPAAELSVRASSAGASFESRMDGIDIDNRGATGDYEILIPAQAKVVEVRLGNNVLFSWRDGQVRTGGTLDGSGRYLVPLRRGVR